MGKIEIYKDKKREFRWRLRARNGKIIAHGESYKSKRNLLKSLNVIITELLLWELK